MKSWVNAKLEYLNLDVELLDVDMCFNGKFGYDVNIMKVFVCCSKIAHSSDIVVVPAYTHP